MFVSDKDLRVIVNGVVATFKAGEPRPLRPALIEAALEQGVRKVGGGHAGDADKPRNKLRIFDEIPDEPDIDPGAATIQEVIDATRKLMEEGREDAFTATGLPRDRLLEDMIGKRVTRDQRRAAIVVVRKEANL